LFWDAMVGNEIMILWYTGKLYLRHVIQLFIFIIKLALPDPVLAYVLDWKPSVEPELGGVASGQKHYELVHLVPSDIFVHIFGYSFRV